MDDLRIGHAERDAAVKQLTAHHAAGRLSAEEMTARSAAARAAVTRGELHSAMSDLPDMTSFWYRGFHDPGWRIHALVALLVEAAIVGVWLLVRDPHPRPADYGTDYWWPIWLGLAWAIVVLLHYLRAGGLLDGPLGARARVRARATLPIDVGRSTLQNPRSTGGTSASVTVGWAGQPDQPERADMPDRPEVADMPDRPEVADVPARPEAAEVAYRPELAVLTEREREVLALLGRGQANKQIARQLSISERTARTHVSNILRKLGLASRTQAALLAARPELAGGGRLAGGGVAELEQVGDRDRGESQRH